MFNIDIFLNDTEQLIFDKKWYSKNHFLELIDLYSSLIYGERKNILFISESELSIKLLAIICAAIKCNQNLFISKENKKDLVEDLGIHILLENKKDKVEFSFCGDYTNPINEKEENFLFQSLSEKGFIVTKKFFEKINKIDDEHKIVKITQDVLSYENTYLIFQALLNNKKLMFA